MEIAGDALRVLLGATFVWYGYFDVRPSPARKEEFRQWGFPPWVQPAGGVMQLLAVVLLIPLATVAYGALLLLAMMLFSVFVHLAREHKPRRVPWPAILGGLAVVTALLYGGTAWGPAGAFFHAALGTV